MKVVRNGVKHTSDYTHPHTSVILDVVNGTIESSQDILACLIFVHLSFAKPTTAVLIF